LRSTRFVTQKIIYAASEIKKDPEKILKLGNMDIERDWGWAPDYVEAMWLMLQQDIPQNIVIATGRTVSLKYFTEQAFSYFGLDWESHVQCDTTLMRPSDIQYGAADPTKGYQVLGWQAKHDVDDVVRLMCEAVSHFQDISP